MKVKNVTKMLKVFFTTFLLITWLSIGSMDILQDLQNDIEEIKNIPGQEYNLKQKIEDLEDIEKENAAEITKKLLSEMDNNKIKEKDLKDQHEELQKPMTKLIMENAELEAIMAIVNQRKKLEEEKKQIEDEYAQLKTKLAIHRYEAKQQLNLKKSGIQTEISALLENKIEKQMKVTKMVKEQFEIFKAKIEDETKKTQIIEQEKKFLASIKINEKKPVIIYRSNGITMQISSGANIGKIYTNPINNMTLIIGKVNKLYIDGKEVKEEKMKSIEDDAKYEPDCIADIDVLEESFRFLIDFHEMI